MSKTTQEIRRLKDKRKLLEGHKGDEFYHRALSSRVRRKKKASRRERRRQQRKNRRQ